MEKALSNRALAQVIFSAMNTRDLSELDQCLSENATFDFPGAGLIKGRNRILAFLKVLFRKYPQLFFTVEDVMVDGDRANVLWTNKGENMRGDPYKNRGVTFVKLTEGKIVFISDYFKDTSFVETP